MPHLLKKRKARDRPIQNMINVPRRRRPCYTCHTSINTISELTVNIEACPLFFLLVRSWERLC